MPDLDATFAVLRALHAAHVPPLVVTHDAPGRFEVVTTRPGPRGEPMWFGGVRTGARYVSFHLMPVYVDPGLLDGASEALRRRMQGKSCFNFTDRTLTADLEAELAALTAAGLGRFRETGLA